MVITGPMSQDAVNELMRAEGVRSYDARHRAAVGRGQESTTQPGRYLLRESIDSLTAAFREWLEKAKRTPGRKHVATKYLSTLNLEVAALITAQIVLDQISTEQPYLSTAYAIATALEDEARFTEFKKRDPIKWSEASALGGTNRPEAHRRSILKSVIKAADEAWTPWSRIDRYHLGTVAIELLAQATSLIAVVNKRNYVRSGRVKRAGLQAVIQPTQETLDWLEKSNEEHRIRFPLYLPTVTPPVPWTDPQDGGYEANVYMRWSLFRVRRALLREMTEPTMPGVYAAVNALQATAWKINDNVFETFDTLWCAGGGRGGIPDREAQPLPPKPDDIGTNEFALKAWKRDAARAHAVNWSSKGARTLCSKIHYVARHFSNQPFHFPHKVDFRGRVYPIPSFLNPQGNDLAKGLLTFAERKPVDTPAARRWLAIHGANCYGLDKTPFAEREAWVEANTALITEASEDPLGTTNWTDASDPWQFLAWCFEWSALLEAEASGLVFSSSLPVAMDGTNNGLQLFSLLLRDPISAFATNVLPSAVPHDIYQDVADRTTRLLQEDADGSLDEIAINSKTSGKLILRVSDMARLWLAFSDGRLPRAATKRSVMIVPYSGTKFACREYIEDWYSEQIADRKLQDNRPFAHTFSYCRYLADLVWTAIHEVVIGARVGMTWLQDVAGICTDAGIPIRWTTPSGFRVEQAVHKHKTSVVKTKVGDIVRKRNARLEIDELSRRGQQNGLAPNFIHSLDASIMTLTVNRCVAAGITSFAMVHDSYATHAADAPALAATVRAVVAETFSRDLLQEFSDEVSLALKCGPTALNLPPVPPYGSLDPAVVIDSQYFFA